MGLPGKGWRQLPESAHRKAKSQKGRSTKRLPKLTSLPRRCLHDIITQHGEEGVWNVMGVCQRLLKAARLELQMPLDTRSLSAGIIIDDYRCVISSDASHELLISLDTLAEKFGSHPLKYPYARSLLRSLAMDVRSDQLQDTFEVLKRFSPLLNKLDLYVLHVDDTHPLYQEEPSQRLDPIPRQSQGKRKRESFIPSLEDLLDLTVSTNDSPVSSLSSLSPYSTHVRRLTVRCRRHDIFATKLPSSTSKYAPLIYPCLESLKIVGDILTVGEVLQAISPRPLQFLTIHIPEITHQKRCPLLISIYSSIGAFTGLTVLAIHGLSAGRLLRWMIEGRSSVVLDTVTTLVVEEAILDRWRISGTILGFLKESSSASIFPSLNNVIIVSSGKAQANLRAQYNDWIHEPHIKRNILKS